jgi:hypothetical protein
MLRAGSTELTSATRCAWHLVNFLMHQCRSDQTRLRLVAQWLTGQLQLLADRRVGAVVAAADAGGGRSAEAEVLCGLDCTRLQAT